MAFGVCDADVRAAWALSPGTGAFIRWCRHADGGWDIAEESPPPGFPSGGGKPIWRKGLSSGGGVKANGALIEVIVEGGNSQYLYKTVIHQCNLLFFKQKGISTFKSLIFAEWKKHLKV